jgi:uncharacterized alkaline shock family protein YloU
MEVYALVGSSGTGKSHRALVVAHEYGIDTIIDDGLLIKDSKILAGTSAKKEPSKIMAVRRAIFMDLQHADAVSTAIEREKPSKILILGTSDNMIEKITEALRLPSVHKIIRIEEIATKAEIAKAKELRTKEGKHVIPLPTIEVKPHFSGYLVDPLEIFFKRQYKAPRHKLGEKSIVRPAFSYFGKLLISDATIAEIASFVAKETPGITSTGQINITNIENRETGLTVVMDVTVKYGMTIWDVVVNVQHKVKEMVEYMTGLNVKEVNIEVKRLSVD